MNCIILTVQSNGSGGYRFGINTKDSKKLFRCRGVKVRLHLSMDSEEISCNTACGNPCDNNGEWLDKNPITKKPFKKGYDLNNKKLSNWIKENKYCCYQKGNPTKLKFNLSCQQGIINLTFDSKIDNKNETSALLFYK